MPLGVARVGLFGGDVTPPGFTAPADGASFSFRMGKTMATQSSNIAVSATDDSGLAVGLSASNLPAGLSFADNGNSTGTISGTPDAVTSTTTNTVTLTATDVAGNIFTRNISIAIQPNYFGDSSDGAYNNEND